MDFTKAFQFPFEDEEWATKVGIGALLSVVPVLNFAAFGYASDVLRNVAHNQERPMGNWDDFGDYFMKGLYLFVAQFVYQLVPSILIGVAVIPLAILPILGGGNEDAIAALGTATAIGISCVAIIGVLLGIAISIVFAAGFIRFSLGTQELGVLFDIGGHWKFIQEHTRPFLTAILYLIGYGFVLGLVITCLAVVLNFIPICGQILAWVVGAAAGFLIMLFMAHIFGQLAQEAGLAASPPPME